MVTFDGEYAHLSVEESNCLGAGRLKVPIANLGIAGRVMMLQTELEQTQSRMAEMGNDNLRQSGFLTERKLQVVSALAGEVAAHEMSTWLEGRA
jgi:hypothetical protein